VEKPILFSGEMVRAILAGNKTQTRRIMKTQPTDNVISVEFSKGNWYDWCVGDKDGWKFWEGGCKCPYEVGMLLWVRERFYVRPEIWALSHKCRQPIHYHADTESETVEDYASKPSIHMPRWASRITMEVKAVRVERVQEITPSDCVAEGVEWQMGPDSTKLAFKDLWDSINEKRGYGWETDPWVWVVEFEKVAGAE